MADFCLADILGSVLSNFTSYSIFFGQQDKSCNTPNPIADQWNSWELRSRAEEYLSWDHRLTIYPFLQMLLLSLLLLCQWPLVVEKLVGFLAQVINGIHQQSEILLQEWAKTDTADTLFTSSSISFTSFSFTLSIYYIHSLASGYASQHILSWSSSPETG